MRLCVWSVIHVFCACATLYVCVCVYVCVFVCVSECSRTPCPGVRVRERARARARERERFRRQNMHSPRHAYAYTHTHNHTHTTQMYMQTHACMSMNPYVRIHARRAHTYARSLPELKSPLSPSYSAPGLYPSLALISPCCNEPSLPISSLLLANTTRPRSSSPNTSSIGVDQSSLSSDDGHDSPPRNDKLLTSVIRIFIGRFLGMPRCIVGSRTCHWGLCETHVRPPQPNESVRQFA